MLPPPRRQYFGNLGIVKYDTECDLNAANAGLIDPASTATWMALLSLDAMPAMERFSSAYSI